MFRRLSNRELDIKVPEVVMGWKYIAPYTFCTEPLPGIRMRGVHLPILLPYRKSKRGKMNLENALKIPGWMAENELRWLAEQGSLHTRIIEVGSYLGRSTRALAENTRGDVIAVDTWLGSNEFSPEQTGPEGWMFAEFQKNMAGLDNVSPMQMSSMEAAYYLQSFKILKYSMIFIDAAHDYRSVSDDIREWMPLVKPGGLLCGHDYLECHPGVCQAVKELVPGFKTAGLSIWYKEIDK